MLILGRKKGQVIHIDGGITITIVDVQDRYVQVGVTAPRHITVDRQEVALRKQAEREAS